MRCFVYVAAPADIAMSVRMGVRRAVMMIMMRGMTGRSLYRHEWRLR